MNNPSLTVAILVPTAQRPEMVERLLQSIKSSTIVPNEIMFIDASEDKKTSEICQKWKNCTDLNIIYKKSPIKSLTFQRNYGISYIKSDLILFLDDDIVIKEDFIFELKNIFDHDTKKIIGGGSGVISGLSVTPIDYLGYLFGYPVNKPGSISKVGMPVKVTETNINETTAVSWLSGGMTMYRKEVFIEEHFSLFFQGYGLGEDKEFSIRLSKKWKLVANPKAICFHIHASGGRPNNFERGWQHIRNSRYIFIHDLYSRRIDIQLLYIWTQFGIVFTNLVPLFLHPIRNRKQVNLIAGNLYGLWQIINGNWNNEYKLFLKENENNS